MEITLNDEPCLVNATQGSSCLKTVQYKNKFLYSKYSPDRTITKTIQELTILPGSIILITSPVLWYGLEELLNKTDKNSIILAIEADEKLYNLSLQHLDNKYKDRINYFKINSNNLVELDAQFRDYVNTGNYRRLIPIDFSAGSDFSKPLYDFIKNGFREIIERFWKNRVTLLKMGKLYSKNLFKNLPFLCSSHQLSSVEKSINCPILVCGAGESIEFLTKENTKGFFIIAVDAAFIALQKKNINVDAVVLVESQIAIEKCFIGTNPSQTVLFSDITSRPHINRLFNNHIFFSSEYCDALFYSNLYKENILSSKMPSQGSVGLTAVEIAKIIRTNDNIPIFVTGMDFSFSLGKTHAKGTFQEDSKTYIFTKLNNVSKYNAALSNNCASFIDLENRKMFTNPAMNSYAQLFARTNAAVKNIAVIGKPGLHPFALGITEGISSISQEQFSSLSLSEKNFSLIEFIKNIDNQKISENVTTYLKTELNSLLKIKSLLTKGTASEFHINSKNLDDELKELLINREYLYLHFPDGYKLSITESFLKRIRAELDVFIKIINSGIK